MYKTGTYPVAPDGGYHQPIDSNSLGALGSQEVLYAFCRRCPHERKLDTGALLARYGDLPLGELERRLRCTACGGRGAELRRVWRLPGYPRQ